VTGYFEIFIKKELIIQVLKSLIIFNQILYILLEIWRNSKKL